MPALYACQPGLDVIGRVGIAAIREKSVRQTERLRQGAERGWTFPISPQVTSPRWMHYAGPAASDFLARLASIWPMASTTASNVSKVEA